MKSARTTVSAHNENSVICRGFSDKVGKLFGLFPKGCFILKERFAFWIILEVLDRIRVQRRGASSRRSYGNIGMGSKDIIRVSELGLDCNQLVGLAINMGQKSHQVPSNLFPCVTDMVMGCQYE